MTIKRTQLNAKQRETRKSRKKQLGLSGSIQITIGFTEPDSMDDRLSGSLRYRFRLRYLEVFA